MRSRPTFNKRQREQSLKERRLEKDERRKERRARKGETTPDAGADATEESESADQEPYPTKVDAPEVSSEAKSDSADV